VWDYNSRWLLSEQNLSIFFLTVKRSIFALVEDFDGRRCFLGNIFCWIGISFSLKKEIFPESNRKTCWAVTLSNPTFHFENSDFPKSRSLRSFFKTPIVVERGLFCTTHPNKSQCFFSLCVFLSLKYSPYKVTPNVTMA